MSATGIGASDVGKPTGGGASPPAGPTSCNAPSDGLGGQLARPSEGIAEALAVSAENEVVRSLLERSLGERVADAFTSHRRTAELAECARHPDETLRERKKRRTRQRISDIATVMFLLRGFDSVTVADIAGLAGVSEKTAFNYFPTKESMVFDEAEDAIARLSDALRSRQRGESPTRAVVRALKEDVERDLLVGEEFRHATLPLFAEMVMATPSLRAAWLDLHRRAVLVAMDELSALAQVDPLAPEPMIAARALVGLHDIAFAAQVRRSRQGLRGEAFSDAVLADIERAARLLDTGLWSFSLLAQGARTKQQLREAAKAAEEARGQVVSALRQARDTWRELRGEERRRREGVRREDVRQRERRRRS